MDIVRIAIQNARLTLSILLFFVIAGALAYVSIPKEAEPDVPIPIIYVSLGYQGISPEDSERLLLRPIETRLKSLEGVKEMRSSAFQSGGFVLVEFQAGYDFSNAIEDVRAKVADARRELPQGADEPSVHEVNISEFPILVVTLAGNVPERVLSTAARELRDQIEEIPGVLEGTLQGSRDELVEVLIDPMKLSSYNLQLDQMIAGVGASNSLVAAGSLEGQAGRYAVKVPSLIETVEDVANLPIVSSPDAVVRARDLADIRSTFKDASTITRLNGQNAIAIEVKKRVGANLVETVDAVKAIATTFQEGSDANITVSYSQDKSVMIRDMLKDLQNHVLIAVILVFIVVLYTLSGRASLLIGLAVPASFLMGIYALSLGGFTVNMVVLFSLILAVGMLVDDAIIVTEFAERRMSEGMDKAQAFELAAKRMAGPVIAATMTRIAAFSPLLFWPGIVGEFMKYLPITLIVTLSASMIYALIFTPTLGALFAKAHVEEEEKPDGWYMGLVKQAVRFPKTVLLLTIALLGGIIHFYGEYGAGIEFFPSVEPEYGLMYVHARGNISLEEMDRLTRPAEEKLLNWPGIESVYTRVGKTQGGGQDIDEDVISVIQYEFIDWRERAPASEILDDLRKELAGTPGVEIEVRVPDAGPPTGQPIQIRLSAADPAPLNDQAAEIAQAIAKVPGVIDISDGLPPPGIDWAIKVDRAKAAQYGISPVSVGTVVQLVTNGLKLSEYRPAGVDDAVDIRLRLPEDRRTLSTLDQLRVQTAQGPVPISNFVTREPERATGTLNRIDGQRTIVISANVASGYQVAAVQAEVINALSDMDLGESRWKLAGSNEESEEASAFLMKAFGAAIFLIFVVLLAQFNKFTSVFLVLMTVVMATIGVFLGLLITGQPFGIVMSGIGVIALAGVVVNNNIVLIDTYDRLRREGWKKQEAILQTCRERARPVMLTAISAVLGVLPIAFGLGLELFHQEVTIGAPSTQWWVSLSSAIVFGLTFATALTLIVTPSALMVFTRETLPAGHQRRGLFARLFRRRKNEEHDPANTDMPGETFTKAAE
ncbi:efflux RND transporter permease subunit [Nitratireductor aquimarinus]|uniref:efflux RND transporter permease subunit n=1 Tax=Nitratireductor TaxID=245876 RepID=UPI0019D3622E|nr:MULTISPECIES: efflux RND transporter permease subunit [Nitratireductor]MBN7762391.1 efflux RND transporter permease subunit [Nitratireductor aquibiodomus]MBN7777884.1 efflux RND transporter permease subunit [Nitratireductor pacificus]MBN7782206.1 efflux RND transporter permease subunit [Nitratireductor pacificus]MBN7791013.1 efflux RND transporter permease subunit [Nitratireductor aquimarinus]MBN8244360.1 efflux RND transporter permease subunit [Nitratireductor aquimarinus]